VVIRLECRGELGLLTLLPSLPSPFPIHFYLQTSLYPSSLIPPGGSCMHGVWWWVVVVDVEEEVRTPKSRDHSKFESSGLPDRKVWIWDISFPSDRTNVLSLHSKRKDGFQPDRMNTLDEGLPLDIFPSSRTATFFILSGGSR
jgi:hypothetical protein